MPVTTHEQWGHGRTRVDRFCVPGSNCGSPLTRARARCARLLATVAAVVFAATPVASAQVSIVSSPASRAVAVGSTRTLTPTIQVPSGTPAPAYQWYRDNRPLSGQTALSLVIPNVQPADAGAYVLAATSGGQTVQTDPAFLGIALDPAQKVAGNAYEFQADIQHPNGNWYDQILMTGPAASVRADAGQVTRTSFIDLNDDIVQVEFSGAGTLTLILQSSTAPAVPAKYNQPDVTYMKGHPTLTIVGADETTNVTIFSVGRMTAHDPSGTYDIAKPPSETNDPALTKSPLFKAGEVYDGVADVALLNIASADGKFGGIRAANARFYAVAGNTGVLAPNVEFTGPVYLHDVNASDTATPLLVTGTIAGGEIWITGGNLQQPNAKAVEIAGALFLAMEDGTSSHGTALPAQANAGEMSVRTTPSTSPTTARTAPYGIAGFFPTAPSHRGSSSPPVRARPAPSTGRFCL